MKTSSKLKMAVATVLFSSIICLPVISGGETVRDTEKAPVTYIKDASSPLEHLPSSEALKNIVILDKAIEANNFHKLVTTAHNEAVAEQKRLEAQRAAAKKKKALARSRTLAPKIGIGRCGGDLPPCYVMMRESRGDIHAENPVSTASGKWQFLDSTWNNFGGYSHASYAPESVQDAKARLLWANGAGCSHWSAC